MTDTLNIPPYTYLNSESDHPLSYKGRFGRLSYLAWSLVSGLIFALIAGVFLVFFAPKDTLTHWVSGNILESLGTSNIIVGSILYLILIYFTIIFGIRRLHDIDRTGWWILLPQLATINKILKLLHISNLPILSGALALISIIFWLYLIFAKGTEGANQFGSKRPMPQWEKVTGWIYIVLVSIMFVIGILAAIAIPAYQSYLKRTHTSELSQSSAEPAQTVTQ